MNSPHSTSDSSSWNHAGSHGAPATDVTDEAGMDPGSIPPQETRLRGIDIHPQRSTENTLARPVEIHPTDFAPTRVMSPSLNQANSMTLGTNPHLLLGFQGICGVCNLVTTDPALCADCCLSQDVRK